jgi:hypothetical protein
MFSEDGTGRSWTQRTTIHAGLGSSGYTCIREIAPGTLLFLYDCDPDLEEGDRTGTGADTSQPLSVFQTVEITVTRR